MNRIATISTIVLSMALLFGAGCSGPRDVPGGEIEITLATHTGGLVKMGASLVMTATGFQQNEYPVVVEVYERTMQSQRILRSTSRLSADRSGAIGPVILVYDLGLEGWAPLLSHDVTVTSEAGITEAHFSVGSADTSSVVYACDSQGNVANAFQSGAPVYVAAKGLTPGHLYRIWPLKDRRMWNDGVELKSWKMEIGAGIWPGELPEYIVAAADYAGEIQPVQLLPYATKAYPGITDQFDIVLDAEPYGFFNASTDAVDGDLPTGVVVQDPAGGGHIIQQLAARKSYQYTDIFTKGEDVYVWLNPGVIVPGEHKQVIKWITDHQAIWEDGASLSDITAGEEHDVVQPGCVNEGLILVWSGAQIGEYDVVVDVNMNNKYEEGTDILDGGSAGPGFRVME